MSWKNCHEDQKKHELKIVSPYYEAVLSGEKTFEIRKNDRDFSSGDIVFLWHFDSEKLIFTGRSPIAMRVGFITDYEQKEGYVVFSLKNL